MSVEWGNLPPKAAEYVQTIAEWQEDNGGFRRLPPRTWNVKLSNWVQFCRTAFRNGKLGKDIADALLTLGISMDFATHGIQPHPEAYEKARRAIDMIEAAEAGADVWLTDPFVVTWIAEMQDLAATRPSSPLLDDLREMIPDVFFTCIAPFLGEQQAPPALGRGTDAVLAAITAFFGKHWRAPDIRASDERERQLASWMIRLEHDLVGEHAFSKARADEQHELLGQLTTILAEAGPRQRLAQWHWWSICALRALAKPEVGNRWHALVYKPTVGEWSRRLGMDPTNDWPQQTQTDKGAGRIATVRAVHVALTAAMQHSNERQKAILDAQRDQEEFFARHGWTSVNRHEGQKRGLSRGH